MIINTNSLSALFTSYNNAFKSGFGQAKPDWSKISTLVQSKGEINMYAFLGQFPQMREWLDERIIKNMESNDYSVTNKDWESTVAVPRPKLEDDTYGIFTPIFEEMGYSAAMLPDETIFAKLLVGATDLCYDGQAFFDASHPIVASGAASTASNYDVTGGGNMWCLMDTKHPLKPMIWQERKKPYFQAYNKPSDEHVFKRNEYLYGVDSRGAAAYGYWQMAYASLNTLNATNYESYLATMMAYKSNEDKPLNIRPNLLVCGPSNYAAARTLLDLQVLATGATNPHYKEIELLVSPQMT